MHQLGHYFRGGFEISVLLATDLQLRVDKNTYATSRVTNVVPTGTRSPARTMLVAHGPVLKITLAQDPTKITFGQDHIRTRFGSLEFQIGSLESQKIIIGSLKSEKFGFLESEKSGPYRSIPGQGRNEGGSSGVASPKILGARCLILGE